MDSSGAGEPWEHALSVFIDHLGGQLRWMLVGSAATAVHGVVIVPGDVDILIHPDTTDSEMHAELARMNAFAASSVAADDLATFLSTRECPLFATADGSWLFGRWTVHDCHVEVARIREPIGATLLLETLGPAVWEYQEIVSWHGRQVPVVPLEVQLATMVARGLDQRASAVRSRLTELRPGGELTCSNAPSTTDLSHGRWRRTRLSAPTWSGFGRHCMDRYLCVNRL